MRFFVVPHTHWDREWYLPFEAFQLRLAAVVDEVIEVLETDPSFASFTLDGQAIVLEDYLDARLEQEARLNSLLDATALLRASMDYRHPFALEPGQIISLRLRA